MIQGLSLGNKLAIAFAEYHNNAHPDDRMPFRDWCECLMTFEGHRVIVQEDEDGMEEVVFEPIITIK